MIIFSLAVVFFARGTTSFSSGAALTACDKDELLDEEFGRCDNDKDFMF